MPLDTPTRTRVMTYLTNAFTAIKTKQDAYYLAHGRYFQCIKTLTVVDGTTQAPDLTRKPYYQAESPSDLGLSMANTDIGIEVHQYKGPQGDGWVAFARVAFGGSVYVGAKGSGPENRDSASWVDEATGA